MRLSLIHVLLLKLLQSDCYVLRLKQLHPVKPNLYFVAQTVIFRLMFCISDNYMRLSLIHVLLLKLLYSDCYVLCLKWPNADD
jgi:hypothetical protein